MYIISTQHKAATRLLRRKSPIKPDLGSPSECERCPHTRRPDRYKQMRFAAENILQLFLSHVHLKFHVFVTRINEQDLRWGRLGIPVEAEASYILITSSPLWERGVGAAGRAFRRGGHCKGCGDILAPHQYHPTPSAPTQ